MILALGLAVPVGVSYEGISDKKNLCSEERRKAVFSFLMAYAQ